MKIKCFHVESIPYKNKSTGADQVMYKVWFMTPKGLCWLISSKEYNAGDEVEVELYPTASIDVKHNLELGLRIVLNK